MLVFAYAVDGGLVNGVFDTLHKLVSPQTYPCNLCALTYGPLGPRTAWTQAIADLGVPTEFLHRDELAAKYGDRDTPLPAVFLASEGALTPLIGQDEIDACSDLEALIALVRDRVAMAAGGSTILGSATGGK